MANPIPTLMTTDVSELVRDRILDLRGQPRSLELHGPLSLPRQLAVAWWRSRTRAEGAMPPGRESALCPIECVWRGVRANARRLDRYRAVCGHPDTGFLPAVWLESLFIGPMAAIVLSDFFPLSPLGLIHIAQRITLCRPVGVYESLDLLARLAAVRQTSRGFELDLALELRSGDEVPWSGLATLLSRNIATRARGGRDGPNRIQLDDSGSDWCAEDIEVPADLGRRYARASGDWNPQHLWPITAQALGYRRPIAHGMWSLGRVIAKLDRQLAPPWTVEARFQRPVFLPGRVKLRWRDTGHETEFEVRDSTTLHPHLSGRAFNTKNADSRSPRPA